ncbi:hypothetical protein M9458_023610 [Cirrhinus mrigala]|uniref:SCAN box domain-containing protein n=1 Tax=Cirrhinus mrigala TaxID=683832 RepID=A0ABD0Q4J6_CIRMR
MEHIATRQERVEEDLAALHHAAAQRAPLPDPRVQATQLLLKLTGHDDVELYLQIGLGPKRVGTVAGPVANRESADDYDVLKREILGRLGLSPISAAQLFHVWEYQPRRPARAQASELARLTQRWLLDGNPTAGQVAERGTIDRLLRALPPSTRRAVGMRNHTTLTELVESIELAEAAHQRKPGERAPSFPRRVFQERRSPEGTSQHVPWPAAPGPADEPMPTKDATPPPRAWLAGCVLHHELPQRDSVSLVKSAILPPRKDSKSRLPITCVHGDTHQVPARHVTLTAGPGEWQLEIGILKEDCPGFEQLLAAATQPAGPSGSRRRRRTGRRTSRPALLASDSGRDGEAQREDKRLKHCWAQNTILSRTSLSETACCTVSPSGGGRQSSHMPTRWLATSEPPTPFSVSGTAFIGRASTRQACATCQRIPLIPLPIIEVPFLLQTDASDTGLGAVLSQVRDGEEHPVMYISRKLTPPETHYAAVEKEALAIRWAVLELRYYLLGRRFTLLTDHAPLLWMAKAKATNARVTRWFLALQDFHFSMEHCPFLFI